MCSKASAHEVLMAFSQEIPPYIIETSNSGIEIDIISAALAYKGHTLKPLYFPLGRVPIAFRQNQVDAAMGDMGVHLKDGFYANPAVIYDNIFITLKSRNITINKPSDLDSLHVASFQGAEKRYPDWLNNVVKENRFFGVSDQLKQVELLQLGRFDVVLCDRYIFKYFVNKIELMKELEISDVDEHNFITVDPMNYRPVFRDKQIRDDFNLGLRYLKESGEFQKIYDKYLAS
ncbi:substrate-binding periplasmic protein [Colwellia sp. Bg11-28]|uniref:Putative amino acid-binding protein n=2 Tax=Colwellia psychrerythraea TaxID=28229 RepID=Q480L4_COLP3|nr:ABC transporter substrate-binding protein [Colwellia sp. Bg11-28]AAZ28092.1 putative amino acid-binding protein [Colwellia psychrerythraea 34H]